MGQDSSRTRRAASETGEPPTHPDKSIDELAREQGVTRRPHPDYFEILSGLWETEEEAEAFRNEIRQGRGTQHAARGLRPQARSAPFCMLDAELPQVVTEQIAPGIPEVVATVDPRRLATIGNYAYFHCSWIEVQIGYLLSPLGVR